jgi:hypothetical protein
MGHLLDGLTICGIFLFGMNITPLLTTRRLWKRAYSVPNIQAAVITVA